MSIRKRVVVLTAGLGCVACLNGCGSGSALELEVERFVAAKEIQARQLASAQTNPIPALTWRLFDAVQADDWVTASNRFHALEGKSGRRGTSAQSSRLREWVGRLGRWFGQDWSPSFSGLQSAVWAPLSETYGLYELTHEWNPRWLKRYAGEIIQVVPERAIYFGGTDPGRFAVSCYSESHIQGRPFLTITQNQLADATYLDYLQSMYGSLMGVPTPQDAQNAFQQYLSEAQERSKQGALKPGENVRISGGRIQLSGQTAVMEINALLVKSILEKNPGRDFYLEESFPLDSLCPQLEPQGPIFRLHATPLGSLSAESLEANRRYWNQFLTDTLGARAIAANDLRETCRYLEGFTSQGESAEFSGDRSFLADLEARKAFAWMRSAQARLYTWRAAQTTDAEARERMSREAELAFRQALVLWPESATAADPNARQILEQYAAMLREQGREEDALLILGAGAGSVTEFESH